MLTENKESYCICDDFNIDLLQTETNKVVKNYVNTLYILGCVPQIKYPTRIAPASTTLIDHICTNNITHEMTSCIFIETDRLPVLLLIKNVKLKIACTNTYIRDIKTFQQINFCRRSI